MKKIMYSSDRAAEKIVSEVWLSSTGEKFLNEHIARYAGCTHVLCHRCKTAVIPKSRLLCDECSKKQDRETWEKLPSAEWNGTDYIMCMDGDELFSGPGDIADYCVNNNVELNDLLLMHTKPLPIAHVELEDVFTYDCVWDGDIHESDIHDSVKDAINKLNEELEKMGSLGVQQTNLACTISDDMRKKIVGFMKGSIPSDDCSK